MIIPYFENFPGPQQAPPRKAMENLVFHIGMIELVSYWKAACPGEIHIRPYRLGEAQQEWWLDLYYKGLGEFFHTNGIKADREEFARFSFGSAEETVPFSFESKGMLLVPVGGGKDSAVTLEIMSAYDSGLIPFVINPRHATDEVIRLAGKSNLQTMTVMREIDPLLLKLNSEGFLNGHTPFSAVVAFYALLGAVLCRRKMIVLSNESSANEATIPGTDINHQFSKTFEFESAFRSYSSRWITESAGYFSLLRPLSELQIAALFSGMPKYFQAFRSCNAGSKRDEWCGKCSKCLFTYIMLYPFLDIRTMDGIFGRRLLEDPDLVHFLDQLSGFTPEKPFECIGTLEEVNLALQRAITSHDRDPLPLLLEHYRERSGQANLQPSAWEESLTRFRPDHFLPKELEKELRKKIC